MAVLSCGTESSLGIEVEFQESDNLIQLSSELHHENTVKDDFKVLSLKGFLYRPLDFHLRKLLVYRSSPGYWTFAWKHLWHRRLKVPCLRITNISLCFEHCTPYVCVRARVCVSHFSCVWLCDLRACSPPGSSVHGILQARITQWMAMPSSRDLPNPGTEPMSLISPVVAGRFLTISATWEALSSWYELLILVQILHACDYV